MIKNKELIKRIMTITTPDRPEGDCLLKDPEKKYCGNLPQVIIIVFFEKKRSIFYDERYYGKNMLMMKK